MIDRKNPNTLMVATQISWWPDIVIFRSTDAGATFTATAAAGPPSGGKFKAVAGHEGDLWLTGGNGLYHSTNSGASFAKIAGVDSGISVGLGLHAPGKTYDALYLAGTVGGVAGVHRSDDTGVTWVRINDDQHQYGNMGEAISGDPRVYGRVYLGTNGRGVLYADRQAGPTPSPTASPTGSPTPSPTVSPTTPPTTAPPTGACAVAYSVVNEWSTGFQADVRIKNTGTRPVDAWALQWSFADGQQIGQLWSGSFTQSGAAVAVRNAGWNGAIAPGAAVTFGFTGTRGARNTEPSAYSLNGSACAVE